MSCNLIDVILRAGKEETVESVVNKLKGNRHFFGYIKRCIEYALKIRPKQTESIYLLYNAYGCQQGNEIFNEYIEESSIIENAIQSDDVNEFIKLSADFDFDKQMKIKASKKTKIYFVTEDNDWHKKDINISFMQLMAFYGSVKCFKYALLDSSYDLKNVQKYAIAGGNNEIIHLLEQKGISFDFCFETAVKYHRNEIKEWLLRNYKCEALELSKAIDYYDTNEFFSIINKHTMQSAVNKAFISTAITNNIFVAEYLIKECKVDIERFCNKALHAACAKGNLEFIKFLINNFNPCIEEREKYTGKTALHIASLNGNMDIVKFLVEEYNANINEKDVDGKTALSIACENKNLNIAKYLINISNRAAK